jgi:hypothetical protein
MRLNRFGERAPRTRCAVTERVQRLAVGAYPLDLKGRPVVVDVLKPRGRSGHLQAERPALGLPARAQLLEGEARPSQIARLDP